MKSLLGIIVASLVIAPALFAGEDKAAKSKDACCEETKACSSAKSSCCQKEAAALRQALLTHKGAQLAKR